MRTAIFNCIYRFLESTILPPLLPFSIQALFISQRNVLWSPSLLPCSLFVWFIFNPRSYIEYICGVICSVRMCSAALQGGRILRSCYCFATNHSATLVALVGILHGVNGLDEVHRVTTNNRFGRPETLCCEYT